MMCGLISKKKKKIVYCQSQDAKASKFDANFFWDGNTKNNVAFHKFPEEGDALVCSDACLGLPDAALLVLL